MSDPVRYSDTLTLREEPEVLVMIRMAARKRGQKPSEWVRQCHRMGLRLDGFDPAAIGAPSSADESSASAGAFDERAL